MHSYSGKSLWPLASFWYHLPFLQGIKQAWIRSIHTMRGSGWSAERRTRRAASRKMWEKANVGVRMTANSIPGRCGYCGGRHTPCGFCAGCLITAFGCAEWPLASISGSPSRFRTCSAATLTQGSALYPSFIKPTNKARVEQKRAYEIGVHLPLLRIGRHNLRLLLRRPIRLGTLRSLVSYKASNRHGRSRSVSLEAARACRSAVFTRSDERNVSLIILMSP